MQRILSVSNSRICALIDRSRWEDLRNVLSTLEKTTTGQTRPLTLATKRQFVPGAGAKLPVFSHALWNRAPLPVLQSMVNLDEACIATFDSCRRLPLHVCCMLSSSTATTPATNEEEAKRVGELIDFVLSQGSAGRAALKRDQKGNLPLHYAVLSSAATDGPDGKSITKERLDILEALLATEPSAVSVRNMEGETPLDIARRLFKAGQIDRAILSMLQNTWLLFNHDSSASSFSSSSNRSLRNNRSRFHSSSSSQHFTLGAASNSNSSLRSMFGASSSHLYPSTGNSSLRSMFGAANSSHFFMPDPSETFDKDFTEASISSSIMESTTRTASDFDIMVESTQATGERPPRRNACANLLLAW